MPGYISLHRDIQKHWLYEEERVFSRYEAWLDIMMRVNHAEGKVTHNGTLETVQRGSTIWSMGDMEKHWGWSNKKVKRFLDCLANDQMLTYKSTTKKTYLTIVNYDKYQGSDIDKAPPMHQQSTADAFQKHTNNNDNNSLTTTTRQTLGDVYTEITGQLFMSGMISGFVQSVKAKGYTEAFLIELFLEAGESGNSLSKRYLETIFERWEREKIHTRIESKRRKEEQKGRQSAATDKPSEREARLAQRAAEARKTAVIIPLEPELGIKEAAAAYDTGSRIAGTL